MDQTQQYVTIEQFWEKFQYEILPANAPQMTIDLCRTAFYAGGSALIRAAKNKLPPENTPEDSVKVIDVLLKEINDYFTAYAKEQREHLQQFNRQSNKTTPGQST